MSLEFIGEEPEFGDKAINLRHLLNAISESDHRRDDELVALRGQVERMKPAMERVIAQIEMQTLPNDLSMPVGRANVTLYTSHLQGFADILRRALKETP